jgi:hypothetical protein
MSAPDFTATRVGGLILFGAVSPRAAELVAELDRDPDRTTWAGALVCDPDMASGAMADMQARGYVVEVIA